MAETTYTELAEALHDGLNLCTRARKLDSIQVGGSATIAVWAVEQYERDLAAWEASGPSAVCQCRSLSACCVLRRLQRQRQVVEIQRPGRLVPRPHRRGRDAVSFLVTYEVEYSNDPICLSYKTEDEACAANSSTRFVRNASVNDNVGNEASCPLVLVEWEDSAQPIPGWAYLSSFEAPGIIRCASVGWMIRRDKEMTVLAPNMGGLNDERSLQVSGVIQIPTSCVLRVTELSEPALT